MDSRAARRKKYRTTAPPKLKRVVGLARISKDRDEETSTTTQPEAIESHTRTIGGELVVPVIIERGSAFKRRWNARPEMRQALRYIESGMADTLMVWKLDRACRSLKDVLELVDWLEAHDAYLICVSQPIDTSDPGMGKLMLQIIGALAELESVTKSERIEVWHNHRIENGDPPTGPRPYGYRRTGKRGERNRTLEIVEAEAAFLREAAQSALDGESLLSVERRSEAIGGPQRRALRSALSGPTIAGMRETSPGEFMRGNWPAILDEPTWLALREMMAEPGRRPAVYGRRWLLSSIARCGRVRDDGTTCGKGMRAQTNHTRGARYICPECHLSIMAADLEAIVEGAIVELLGSKEWKRLRRQGRPVDTRKAEAEIADVTAMHERGEISYEIWKAQVRSINEKVRAGAAESLPLPDVDDLRKAWPTLDVDKKRLVLLAAIDRLVIGPGTGGRINPDRIVLETVEGLAVS